MPEPVRLDEVLAKLRAKMEEDRLPPAAPVDPGVCFWCHEDCGGTCLETVGGADEEEKLGPRQMKTSDPAYWMLSDGHVSTPVVHDPSCYICKDPEFAQMGLPLCRECPACVRESHGQQKGHVPADDTACTVCGAAEEYEAYLASQELKGKETG